MKWTEARDSAAIKNYFGLKGYLATITSSVENTFIQSKTKGVGWIGASDAAVEGDWRWVTGPEGLEDGGQGRLFWKGTGINYRNGVSNTGPVNGEYNQWNPNTPEPNNQNGENYAHITYFANLAVKIPGWNDLPNQGGTGDYYPQGYLVEYGGMPGDPVLELTATVEIMVPPLVKAEAGNDLAVCENGQVTLPAISAMYYQAVSWTHNGKGTLLDANTLSPDLYS